MPVPASKNPFALVLDFLYFLPENFITLRDFTPLTLYMYINHIVNLTSLVQIF